MILSLFIFIVAIITHVSLLGQNDFKMTVSYILGFVSIFFLNISYDKIIPIKLLADNIFRGRSLLHFFFTKPTKIGRFNKSIFNTSRLLSMEQKAI